MSARTLWITFFLVLFTSFVAGVSQAQFSKPRLKTDPPADGKKNGLTDDEKDEKVELDIPITNLDNVQKEKLENLQKMFIKLFGHTSVPDAAKQEVRDTLFAALSSSHAPKREKVDQITNNLMDDLREKRLSALPAYGIVEQTAELFGADNVTRQGLEGLLSEIDRRTNASRLGADRSAKMRADFEDLVRTAERDEEKIEQRKLAREEAERKLEEERLAKEAEEKKKEERKSKAKTRGSRTKKKT